MQAGRGRRTRTWVLEFEPAGARSIEPLMGWTSSDDAFAQIRLTFPTLSAAVDYAEREDLDYVVVEPPVRRLIRKDYRETIVGPGFRNVARGIQAESRQREAGPTTVARR